MGPVPDTTTTRVIAETDTTIYALVDLTGGRQVAAWQREPVSTHPMPAITPHCSWWCWLIHRPSHRWHPTDPLLAAALEAARQHRRDRPVIVLEDEAAQLLADAPPVDPNIKQAIARLVRIGRSAGINVFGPDSRGGWTP